MTVLYTVTFAGTTTGLGTDFTVFTGMSAFNVASGTASPSNQFGDCGELLNAISVPANGSGSITFGATVGDGGLTSGCGLMFRATAASNKFYRLEATSTHGTAIELCNAGSFSTMASDATVNWSPGDVCQVVFNGSTFQVYQNGVHVPSLDFTDSTLASGSCGPGYSSTSSTLGGITGFQVTDLGTTYNVAISEAGSAADALANALLALGTLAESGSAAAAAASILAALNTLAEAGASAATTSAAGSVFANTLTESGSAAATASVVYVLLNVVAEAGSAAAALTTLLSAINALSEAGSASDAVSLGSTYSQVIAEAGSAADALTTLLTAVNAYAEAAAAAMASSGNLVDSPTLTESGTAAMAVSPASLLANSIAAAGNAQDVLASIASTFNSATEIGAAADALSPAANLTVLLTEIGAAQDLVASLANTITVIGRAFAASRPGSFASGKRADFDGTRH